MDDRLHTLADDLLAIRSEIEARRGASREPWQARAIAAVIVNLDRYVGFVREAEETGSAEDAAAAAGRVAGIAKGIGDLGILDPEGDRALIDRITATDGLAVRICAAR